MRRRGTALSLWLAPEARRTGDPCLARFPARAPPAALAAARGYPFAS
jgi:hypothetical protein